MTDPIHQLMTTVHATFCPSPRLPNANPLVEIVPRPSLQPQPNLKPPSQQEDPLPHVRNLDFKEASVSASAESFADLFFAFLVFLRGLPAGIAAAEGLALRRSSMKKKSAPR